MQYHRSVRDSLREGREMSASYSELLERLESTSRSLNRALAFITDDRHLTGQREAARTVLREEIDAVERDLEAVKQEHGLA